ncbi:hypothetical protein [Streptomyces qinglanensis]|uniref:hypothetical protein n=1 Tax=Streptomyces qinglanensis TaxID=943816 RepID=UPI003D756E81
MVEEQRAEALQVLVALSHEGFEEVVGSNGAVAEQTLRQVAVCTDKLDEWAMADAREAGAADGKPVTVRLWKAVQVEIATVGFRGNEVASVGHFAEPFGVPRFEQVRIMVG